MEDVDDEDIELLRLTALKSLNVRKESQLSQVYHPQFNNISGTSQVAKYCHSEIDISSKLCLPYLTQANNTIQPQAYTQNHQNVQLSPRSAAFVSENYDILMKRKEDKFRRSPSYKRSPNRWSTSPPPLKQTRVSPEFNRKEDHMRSFEHKSYSFNKNDFSNTKRAMSRSPSSQKSKRYSRSPPKSPLRYKPVSPNFNRSHSRSPNTNTSRLSPIRNSPTRNIKRSTNYHRQSVDKFKKSNNNYSNKMYTGSMQKMDSYNTYRDKRRTKLKFGFKNITEREPISKLKSDKSHRSNFDYEKKKKSPDRNKYLKENESNKRNYDRVPEINVETKSLDRLYTDANLNNKTSKDSSIDEKSDSILEKNAPETEDLQAIDQDNSNESLDEADDGIDLFASEESESENEGRFKCSSTKNDKPKSVPTVSFTKLGDTFTTSFCNLNDVSPKHNITTKNSQLESERNNKLPKDRLDRRSEKDCNNRVSRIKNMPTSSDGCGSERKKNVKAMFKSTFHQVAGSMDEGKPIGFIKSEVRSTESSSNIRSKLNTIQSEMALDKPGSNSVTIPTTTNKKRVHLRLGAVSKSWQSKNYGTQKRTIKMRFNLPSTSPHSTNEEFNILYHSRL